MLAYNENDYHNSYHITGRKNMIVCSCSGISDKKIRLWVQAGEISSVSDIRRQCQAGHDCGTCMFQIKKIIDDAKKNCEINSYRS